MMTIRTEKMNVPTVETDPEYRDFKNGPVDKNVFLSQVRAEDKGPVGALLDAFTLHHQSSLLDRQSAGKSK